jgi:hypothetical protein
LPHDTIETTSPWMGRGETADHFILNLKNASFILSVVLFKCGCWWRDTSNSFSVKTQALVVDFGSWPRCRTSSSTYERVSIIPPFDVSKLCTGVNQENTLWGGEQFSCLNILPQGCSETGLSVQSFSSARTDRSSLP